jgi:plasmid stability protein
VNVDLLARRQVPELLKRRGFMKVQLATRLDTSLRQRLRIYAAVTGRTVEDVVSTALDGYLPPMSDMVRDGGGPSVNLLAEQPEVA